MGKYELIQNGRSLTVHFGLSRSIEDKSIFWARLQRFGFRGRVTTEWSRYLAESKEHKKSKGKGKGKVSQDQE